MVATKSTRSKFWFARIDGPEEFLRQKCNALAEQIDCISCLAAYHTGAQKENPHAHIVIELSSEPQKQTYAVRLKNLFNIEKRSQYSLEVWDGKRGPGACSYLFHEDDARILVRKNFTDDDIRSARDANEVVQRVIAANKEKASNKFVDKAIAKFPDGSTPRELLAYMLKLCKEGELYWPGTFRAKQLIEEVIIKTTPDEEFEQLVDFMEFKIFR